MIRVLQIVDSMDLGGIQSFIMNIYRKIDKSKIQFDFLVFRETEQYFEKEIYFLGGRIYKIPGRRDGILKTRKALNVFFNNHSEYNVVHYQTSSISFIDPIEIAYKHKVKDIIVHAHSTRAPGGKIQTILHKVNKNKISKYSNHYLACGDAALKWMYGKTQCEDSAVIVYNGISLSDYQFNGKYREKIRKEFHISEKYVIGHIGRFSKVKNHKFLLDIFMEIENRKSEAVLLLIGTGELIEEIKKMVVEKGVEKKVIFAGVRSDVDELVSAMDIMVFPSLYEGFPVTLIEAQVSGLPCVISDTISDEVILNDNVKQVSLNEKAKVWADITLENGCRECEYDKFENSEFSIMNTIKKLYEIYGV